MVHIIDNRDVHEISFKDIKVGDFFCDSYDNIFIKTKKNNNNNDETNAFCLNKNTNLKMNNTDCFKLLDVDMKISYTKEDN